MKTLVLHSLLIIWLLTKLPLAHTASSKDADEMVFMSGGKYTSTIVQDTIQLVIQSFLIDKLEVSVQDFDRFVSVTGYITSAEDENGSSMIIQGNKIVERKGVNWRHDERGVLRKKSEYNFPVVHLSMADAEAFAKWKGKRIPTMYEWEYAAKSKPTNEEAEAYLNRIAWYNHNSGSKIQSRGLKEPNSKGLYDLIGNVSEYVSVPKASKLPPGLSMENLSGTMGGCFFWDSNLVSESILAYGSTTSHAFYTGFRCVKDLPK